MKIKLAFLFLAFMFVSCGGLNFKFQKNEFRHPPILEAYSQEYFYV